MKIIKLIRVCMVFLLLLFAASGCSQNSASPAENTELVWDEEAMFGLKQPDGVIREHIQEFAGYSYILEDMTEDEVAATIQAIKDLGFIDNPKVTDISYLAYHKDHPTDSMIIIHYKNKFMDEVTISYFAGSLEEGNRD
ncbi:MAG: hypothetical protein GX115_01815 [Ruminiclostridium sp.]|nr:hypothetical protein [Ruminiclostridium sp.]